MMTLTRRQPRQNATEHRKTHYTCVYLVKVSVTLTVFVTVLYALHVTLRFLVENDIFSRQISALSGATASDLLPAEIQNIIPRRDGKLEVQVVVRASDLVKQIGRVYGSAVDESMVPRETSFVMHNSSLCRSASQLRAIVYVHSSPENADRRALIRATWASRHLTTSAGYRVVFLLGQPSKNGTQAEIENEFKSFGDMVQGDFHDDYKNLTLKAIMGLKWVATYCANAKFALKTDDDAFINIFAFLDLMDSKPSENRLIACSYYPDGLMPVLRYPVSCLRWCVKYLELIGKHHYPQYCAGIAFVLSVEMIPALYDASRSTPFFWVDDVYITGLLPAKVGGVRYLQLDTSFSLDGRGAYDEYLRARSGQHMQYIMAHGLSVLQLLEMWQALLRNLRPDQATWISEAMIENVSRLVRVYNTGAVFGGQIF